MTDVFAVQDEIGQAISEALKVKLSGAPAPFPQYKPSLPAYEAFLKARHFEQFYRPDLLARAREFYEQAIALDPKFALAYCGYAEYFGVRMAISGGASAKRGLSRWHALPGAEGAGSGSFPPRGARHAGHAVAVHFGDTTGTKQMRFHLATASDPVPVKIRFLYLAAGYLLPSGRSDEALQQLDLGLREDPLNIELRGARAASLSAVGRDEEAAGEYREILALNPAMLPAQFPLAAHYVSRGELDQALALCETSYALAPLPEARSECSPDC